MSKDKILKKLTPAAKQTFITLVEEYQSRLLLNAEKSSERITGESNEISVYDLFESLKKMQTYYSNKRYESMNNLLFFSAFVTTLVFLITFVQILPQKGNMLELELILPILLIFSILGSIYFVRNRNKSFYLDKDEKLSNRSIIVIEKWLKVENLLKLISALTFGESKAIKPVSEIIEQIYKKKWINNYEKNQILNLLKMRNNIVHKGESYESVKTNILISSIDTIMKKIGVNAKKSFTNEFNIKVK